jgi:hypothetical protein
MVLLQLESIRTQEQVLYLRFCTKDTRGDIAVLYIGTEGLRLNYICVFSMLSNLNGATGGYININTICSNTENSKYN